MQTSYASSSIHRDPEDTIPSDREPRFSLVQPAVPEAGADTWPSPPPVPTQESRPTVPYAAGAGFWFGPKRHEPLLDDFEEEATESGRPVREWAVDDGPEVRALSTFELWMGLARGEIGPKTRVWRDGMDGWEPVEDVPELAYALLDSVSFDPPIVTPRPLPARLEARTPRTPLTFGSAEAETLAPPEALERGSSEPIASPVRSLQRLRSGFSARRGALSFALGCVVAFSAIGLSLFVRSGAALPEPVTRLSRPLASLVAAPETALPGLSGVVLGAGQRVVALLPSSRPAEVMEPRTFLPFVAPPPPAARSHAEPGQRRSRRSRRR